MISFRQFLMEDAAEQERSALNFLIGKKPIFDGGKKLSLDNIKEILLKSGIKGLEKSDSPEDLAQKTLDELKTFDKSENNLPSLVKFLLKGKIKIGVLKDYYDRYIKNPKLTATPLVKFEDFRSFEQFVDSKHVSSGNGSDDIAKGISEKNAIYHDSEIDIYLGDTKQACILYGQGRKYGLCISRNDSGNLFHNYRWEDELTTYFVYFKDEAKEKLKTEAPAGFIIVDATKNPEEFSYNIIEPNSDKTISKDKLLDKFKPLTAAMNAGKFKHKKIQGDEKAYYKKYHDKSITDFNTLDDKIKFIEMEEEIKDNEWSELEAIVPDLLSSYIAMGHDVPSNILDKNPKFKRQYENKLHQRVQMNIDDKEDLEDYTYDELSYAINHFDEIKTITKEMRNLENLKIRKNVINGVYKGDITVKSKYFLPDLSDIIVSGNFICNEKFLISLKGSPKEVKGRFSCYSNKLINLDGAPKTVGGNFYCNKNKLINLEGAPKTVGGNFYCNKNKLINLEGAPKTVGGDFYCSDNELTSLDGAPKTVGSDFNCCDNELTSLDGAPKTVGGDFYCDKNLTKLNYKDWLKNQ